MKANHRKRWIVVDDDRQILQVSAYILRDLDAADVFVCHTPKQALDVFNHDPHSVSLLVTDWDMPGLDGLELARLVRRRSADLPVVMITGRYWDLNPALAAEAGVRAVVAKPFTITGLQQTVRDVLDPAACDGVEPLMAFSPAA